MSDERDDLCDLLCLDLPHAERIRGDLPDLADVERRAVQAKALADPTRLRVAAALHVGNELCVCDVAWVCGSAQNLVSHHLRQLRSAGLVSSRRDGRLVMYSLTERGRGLLVTLLNDEVLTDSRRSGEDEMVRDV
ncbi:transcriptional regulator [Gordonia iterans]|uniref:Transcriptional regulator n=1 Tax=Gordonia iterans TaxID=1004901 RepID=A0A2S0KGA3_9ACTN|nr:metalloregulator ArsR/SmtB family transcription factor [Gordonia iterans]AVM00717.1 transcriptional regulator [Gordonia iterans]